MGARQAEFDAVVIGAGAAGLAAARTLSQAGRSVAVLEARTRIGGRVLTVRDPEWPLPIELGAEFLHGEAEARARSRARPASRSSSCPTSISGPKADACAPWARSGRAWSAC